MRNFLSGKTAILILGGISILVIIFLIASLGGLTFKPVEPFTMIQVNATDSLGNPPSWNGFVYIIPIMVALLIGLIIILPPDQRKKLLTMAAWLILAGVIFILVLSKNNFGKLFQPPPPVKFEEVVTLVPASTHTPGLVVTPSVRHISSLWVFYSSVLLFGCGFSCAGRKALHLMSRLHKLPAQHWMTSMQAKIGGTPF
jgi:hypothetical protein